MGGHDSGWWGGTHGRSSRKRQVGECALVLRIEDFQARFKGLEVDWPFVLEVLWSEDEVTLQLADVTPRCERKRPRPPDEWKRFVDLEPHPWPVYGTRWFFRCTCNRRCGRLYVVRRGGPILCRLCHDLTYRSAQEYRIIARLGRAPLWVYRASGKEPPLGTAKPRRTKPSP